MSDHATEEPRWKTAIDKALEEDSSAVTYQLATVSSFMETPMPHVRSVIHREFMSGGSPSNPLLLTTTDIRTPKAEEIADNAIVEISWWIEKTQEQWRITGRAYLAPSADAPINHDVKEELNKRLLSLTGGWPANKLIDWEAKRLEVFERMSGHMRASWLRPVPGSLLPGGYEAAKAWPGTLPKLDHVDDGAREETEMRVDAALKNFALLIIEPQAVDYVELGVTPNQRTKFRCLRGGWTEDIVVP